MRELWRRLVRSRLLALELLLTTAAVAVCTLASPLYVIQVLNRYVAFGFDGTLHALTAGMLLVTALLWGLRSLRGRLAAAICLPEDLAHSRRAFDALLDAPCQAIAGPARARLAETPRQLALAEAGHDAGILLTLLDAPFSLLYLLVIFLLHPALGAICLLAALLLTATGVLTQRALGRMREEEGNLTAAQRRLFLTGVTQAEGLRMFGGAETLRRRAREGETRRAASRAGVLLRRQSQANALATVTLLAGTALYAVGAARVVGGDLTVGALIGASLLSQRVLANLAALAPALVLLGQAGQALDAVRRDLDIASSPSSSSSPTIAGESSPPGGVALRRHRGGLELRGLALRSPAGTLLFERCDLRLAPGECLAVAGGPGAGKSTLARALLGLHPPDQGEILMDGVSLSQLSGTWWRRQVVYLPQDPDFLEGSLRETLLWANPALDQAGLEAAMAAVGLDGFVREHPEGFEHVIRDGGRSLPVDFRRRLALARALAVAGGRDGGGMLAVLDDPCLGLEESSRVLVHSLCRRLTASGRTLILCTNDPALMRLAGRVLRLDARPSPLLEPLAPGETGHAA